MLLVFYEPYLCVRINIAFCQHETMQKSPCPWFESVHLILGTGAASGVLQFLWNGANFSCFFLLNIKVFWTVGEIFLGFLRQLFTQIQPLYNEFRGKCSHWPRAFLQIFLKFSFSWGWLYSRRYWMLSFSFGFVKPTSRNEKCVSSFFTIINLLYFLH